MNKIRGHGETLEPPERAPWQSFQNHIGFAQRRDSPMLLFDDGKKLEKAVGEEAAKAIVEVLERFDESQRNASATKGDLRES